MTGRIDRFAAWMVSKLITRALRRRPDFIIGGEQSPYLRRWWLIPRNRIFNVYVHQFLRSDDDRAHHCHPWSNASILLRGCYMEHTIAAGGIHKQQVLLAGDVKLRLLGSFAHRIELIDGPCWTLFITGPRYREWGFHCTHGWVPWQKFTASDDSGAIGPGCGGGENQVRPESEPWSKVDACCGKFETCDLPCTPRGRWQAEQLPLEVAATKLVLTAEREGRVLTIEQKPLKPLAMGHHKTVVSVRPARERA